MVAEIIDGDLFASPRPASPHALASSMLGASLIGSFGGEPGGAGVPGGWWILFEPELHFRRDVLVPDLAGWRRERMPTVPDVAAFELAPDWACEVISPSTGEIDRGRKMRVYARERIGHLWIVDPILRTLEVYRLEDGRWIVAGTYAGTEPACRALRCGRARHAPLVARAVAAPRHPRRRGPGPRRAAADMSSAARPSISSRIVSAPRSPTR